jgi:Fic family protein
LPKDIKEVQNAMAAYKLIPDLDPFNVNDFLKAHQLIASNLIQEAGQFRTVNVAVINSKKERLHTGAHANDVPDLITELFEWEKISEDHSLLKSSAIHFMIEHIQDSEKFILFNTPASERRKIFVPLVPIVSICPSCP